MSNNRILYIWIIFLISCHSPTATPIAHKDTLTPRHVYIPPPITPDSLKREMAEEIQHFLNAGFYDSTALVEAVYDMFYNEKVDTPWTDRTIARAYRKKLLEQASWPKITDFDKLAQAFDNLNALGIVALHNAGNTWDEGEDDANEIEKDLRSRGIKCQGYCFYDTQDVDGAIAFHSLYLSFGSFLNKVKDEAIGRKVISALHQAGFSTAWDQSSKTRIIVKPINWRKRFGNDNCSYAHSKKLLNRF